MESFFGAAAAAPKPFHASAAQQGKSIYERFLLDLCPITNHISVRQKARYMGSVSSSPSRPTLPSVCAI